MSGLEPAAARTCPASEFSYTGGFSSAVVLFPKLSKLLNQENALGAPCLHGDFLLSAVALAGRRNNADRRDPSV